MATLSEADDMPPARDATRMPGRLSRSAWAVILLSFPQLTPPLLVFAWIVAVIVAAKVTAWPLLLLLPDRAQVAALAAMLYGALLWFAVCGAWHWAVRCRCVSEVFAFRRMDSIDVFLVLALSPMLLLTVPAIDLWMSHLIDTPHVGGRGAPRGPLLLTATVFATVVSAPIGEEILFRGLLFTWLRGLRWPDWLVAALGSVAFASTHVVFHGLALSVATLWFGFVLLAVRLLRGPLTPCWLIHLVFSATNAVLLPLAPALRQAIGP